MKLQRQLVLIARALADVHANCVMLGSRISMPKMYKWPVEKWVNGTRFKLLGRFIHEDLVDWLPSSSLDLFTPIIKWSRKEVRSLPSRLPPKSKAKTQKSLR